MNSTPLRDVKGVLERGFSYDALSEIIRLCGEHIKFDKSDSVMEAGLLDYCCTELRSVMDSYQPMKPEAHDQLGHRMVPVMAAMLVEEPDPALRILRAVTLVRVCWTALAEFAESSR